MEEKVFKFIKEHHMIEENDTILVGVSGGADSVCLLLILDAYRRSVPFSIHVVHVEHGIRGEESKEDEHFVETLAKQFGYPCSSISYPVQELAQKEHKSTEEMGREVRYRTFQKIKKEIHAQKIAIAHHMDDQAETVLLNMARGSGLKGMRGILPVREEIIRPLLCINKLEIEQYLKEKGQSFRVDRTNFEEDYARNRIRLRVLPYMQESINEHTSKHIFEAAERIREAEEFIAETTKKVIEECAIKKEESLHIDGTKLQKYPAFLQKEVLLDAVAQMAGKRKDLTAAHIEQLFYILHAQGEKKAALPYQLEAVSSYGTLRIERIQQEKEKRQTLCYDIDQIPGTYFIEEHNIRIAFSMEKNSSSFNIPKKRCTKWIAYDKIKDTLQIRTRRLGDFLVVDSEGKRQKLKSYFINEKIPRELRDKILLLADGSHILWVFGYRISDAVKVASTTEKIVKIQVQEEN